MTNANPIIRAAIATCAFALAAPAGAAAASSPLDRDRDRVADGLESRLAGVSRRERVRVVVAMSRDASAANVAGLERRVGDLDVSDRFDVVDGFAAEATAGQIRALARQSTVTRVDEDAVVHAANQAGASSFGVLQARLEVPLLDGDADGDPSSYSDDDLVAAVIDTGIDAGHVDLDGGKVLAFKDFVNDGSAPYDDDGHGTHVAATLAGTGEGDSRYRGVAPGAGLVGVKVLDGNGDGYTSDVVAGIDWVVQNRAAYGIEAINLSLGDSECGDGTGLDSQAVDRAVDAGIVVAVAAGNEGPGTCTIGSPGDAEKAITVGAMADLGARGFFQAWFSSRGPTLDGRVKPDVSAPGYGITSARAGTANGYLSMDGTSMATPFTAGVALLMLDAAPGSTPAQVKQHMRDTADDWGRGSDNKTAGTTGPDIDYGAGRLDAYAALAAAGAELDAPPAEPAHVVEDGTLSLTGDLVDIEIPVTDTRFPVAATLIHAGVLDGTSSDPDFDLRLYGPGGGAPLAKSETLDRQEELGYLPQTTGTYKLRVISYRGAGDFFVDISGGSVVTPDPQSTSVLGPTYTPTASPPPSDPGTTTPPPRSDPSTPPTTSPTPTPSTLSWLAATRSIARQVTGALRRSGRRRLGRSSGVRLRVTAPAAGRLGVTVTAVRRGRRLVVGRLSRAVPAASSPVTLSLTSSGRAWLRRTRGAGLAVKVSFSAAGRSDSAASRLRLR